MCSRRAICAPGEQYVLPESNMYSRRAICTQIGHPDLVADSRCEPNHGPNRTQSWFGLGLAPIGHPDLGPNRSEPNRAQLWVSLEIMIFGRRLPARAESRAKSHPVMVWLRFGSDWAPRFGSKPVRTRRSRRFALSRASSALNRTRASRAFPLTSASSSRGPTRAELACRARSQRQ